MKYNHVFVHIIGSHETASLYMSGVHAHAATLTQQQSRSARIIIFISCGNSTACLAKPITPHPPRFSY